MHHPMIAGVDVHPVEPSSSVVVMRQGAGEDEDEDEEEDDAMALD